MEKNFMSKIPVMVIDDSALMRNLISRIIESDDRFILTGTAVNGLNALDKIDRLKPHIITLDIEMPEMDGISFLKEYNKRGYDMPVIILSSVAVKGAHVTMEALTLGAADFITKPSGSVSTDINKIAAELLLMLYSYGSAYQRKKNLQNINFDEIYKIKPALKLNPTEDLLAARNRGETLMQSKDLPRYTPQRRTDTAEVICIGISTGGPAALREVFLGLSKDLPLPVLIVQHMPAGFTEEFAKSLDKISPLHVREARNGDSIEKGTALIAPGNSHILIEKSSGGSYRIRLSDAPPVNGHRPSADVLFESANKVFDGRVLAVIMTGMGRDGARGIGKLYQAGAVTLAQDKESSIVYGMPRMATEAGYIQEVVALRDMADRINKWAKKLTLMT
jgi:two-component system chemotaxis response regulator CheB